MIIALLLYFSKGLSLDAESTLQYTRALRILIGQLTPKKGDFYVTFLFSNI